MDKQWFKDAMRAEKVSTADLAEEIGRDRAVVSRILNGHQPMTPVHAEAFARRLNVALSEVLAHADMFSENPPSRSAKGFANGDAAPWSGSEREQEKVDGLAKAFGKAPGIDVWKVKTFALSLMGYMPGDFLLVDTHAAERARAHDVVVAQVYDWNSGDAITVLRRLEPPVLVAASQDPEARNVHVVDNNNVVIRGKVVASWRT